MSDHRYDYSILAGSKIIIRKKDKILFTREPMGNEWMPGRLGLPGGKYLLNEGIMEGTQRKIFDETGLRCRIKGLFKIIQILMSEKTVYHFIFVADFTSGNTDNATWSDELIWKNKNEALTLTKDELTEYYFPQLLKEYFSRPNSLLPLETIIEQRSFENKDFQEWMMKGFKKN